MPLINCQINLILTWSANCVISEGNRVTTFAVTDSRILVVTPSTHDNTKFLQHFKSRFRRKTNWNKYQSKSSTKTTNQHLDYLIDPSVQGVNGFFVLPFENNAQGTGHTKFFPPKVEKKDHNVMINGKNCFDQPVKNDLGTYDNIRKIRSGR